MERTFGHTTSSLSPCLSELFTQQCLLYLHAQCMARGLIKYKSKRIICFLVLKMFFIFKNKKGTNTFSFLYLFIMKNSKQTKVEGRKNVV